QRDRAQADRVTDRDRAHDTRECVAQVHHHGSSVSSLNVAKPPPSTRIETAGASSWTSALAPATAIASATRPSMRPVAFALSSFRLPAASTVATAFAAHIVSTG